jgi:hypothetical protein
VSAGGLVATSRHHGVVSIAALTTPDNQILVANGNLVPPVHTHGSGIIGTQITVKADIPADDGIRSASATLQLSGKPG